MIELSQQQHFWNSLQSLCGQAFQGKFVYGNAGDSAFRTSTLVMHVRSCSSREIRIPVHVGADRSRTWILTQTETGLRLKHEHRHADGKEDAISQYGGDTRVSGSATLQEFYADSLTASLNPAFRTNVWTLEIVPGNRLAYALRREGTDRRVRFDFDLAEPVSPPPPPWGSGKR